MASMGLQGGTARCYDWFMDFLKCMDESKAPTLGLRRKECAEWLEDYNECLHHEKATMRSHLVERERRRQESGGHSSSH
eukprot:CAMPEP_0202864316 /NCGR_PEP_ID=MMETSP1391-20130828/4605_1 /ASSEMBLY_ACC=CAM_ASM_000867 /TAXON_ID=1034604 /ORGANISM="Chlamydomonas leiostraca, Strain SAG 11-49" /LENGTH=78 /DNA_ID=CAMNT_0049544051 /DNA_START=137 /DNA_END=373 /DNA_ORIENTATION=+